MVVAFRAGVALQVNASSIAPTIASPAAVGDYAIAALSHGATGVTWTVPSGWTQIGTTMSTTSQTLALYGKILASGDIGSASTFTPSSGGKHAVAISVYSGVAASGSVGGQAQASATSTSTTRNAPALACTGLAIEVASTKGTDPTSWTEPAGFTKRASVSQSGSGSCAVAIGDSSSALAGGDTWTNISTTQVQMHTLWLAADAGVTYPQGNMLAFT